MCKNAKIFCKKKQNKIIIKKKKKKIIIKKKKKKLKKKIHFLNITLDQKNIPNKTATIALKNPPKEVLNWPCC